MLPTGTDDGVTGGGGTAPPQLTGNFHHIAVETADLRSCVAWYSEFFGSAVSWTMAGGFSALSHRRLPGISELSELTVADMRFHLFTRTESTPTAPPAATNRFQHVCISVGSPEELRRWRAHWFRLFDSGRYHFARPEPASEIDVDAGGMQSFYAFDVNGLEYEFSYFPGVHD